jgi:ATPase subunit of ABC transporter with duplicated ATPase domains
MLYRFPNIDLYLVVMLSQTVGFVDEPTNRLDIESIESLNTGL